MFKFKINDLVKITAGKDKNQTGKILRVLPQESKVVVEGKNLYRRHLKRQGEQPGSIVELPRAISVANIALICPNCNKPTRVGFETNGETKVRVCSHCKKVISVNETKKK